MIRVKIVSATGTVKTVNRRKATLAKVLGPKQFAEFLQQKLDDAVVTIYDAQRMLVVASKEMFVRFLVIQ